MKKIGEPIKGFLAPARRWIAGGISFLLVLILWLFYGEASPQRKPVLPPIEVARVMASSAPLTLNLPGEVTPVTTVQIRSQVDGILKAVYFEEGSMVKEGDLLYKIDDAILKAQVAEAKANLESNKAKLIQAISQLERDQKLAKKDFVSKAKRDEQKAIKESLEAQVKANEATLEQLRLKLSYTKITAPFTGRISFNKVEVGSLVKAS